MVQLDENETINIHSGKKEIPAHVKQVLQQIPATLTRTTEAKKSPGVIDLTAESKAFTEMNKKITMVHLDSDEETAEIIPFVDLSDADSETLRKLNLLQYVNTK